MVQGEGIVKTTARTNIDSNVVITYACRPYTADDAEEDAKKTGEKTGDDDGK